MHEPTTRPEPEERLRQARERDIRSAEDHARDQAAEQAKVPLDERLGPEAAEAVEEVVDEERQRRREAEARAAARAPRRLRLNVTHGGDGTGYVTCSVFQSENGINWACAGTGVTFGEDWFADVFGAAAQGRRIEFSISGPHEVTD